MKQLSPIASGQTSFDWLEPDAQILSAFARDYLDQAHSMPKERTAVLISCGKNKKNAKDTASELYTSPRFRLSRHIAERLHLQYFVISAKHGLLVPSEEIEPYELSLESFDDQQRIVWGRGVLNQLLSTPKTLDHVILLADDEYAFALGKTCVGLKTDSRTLLPFGDNPMIETALRGIFRDEASLISWLANFCGAL